MPGHSSAAIAAFPWLSCFPGKETVIPSHPSEVSKQMHGKKVQETWGVFEDVYCAGNDSTFMFLQDVMDEVLQLFPSKLIHVGGDESPKVNWMKCPKCQVRMKKEGLKTEHELQSYFIQRMEKYLNNKGRTLIGWDEILEGGLAPNAVVMSWQGEKGGIEAVKQNHDVVMTPNSYVYFDYSQSRNEDSLVIGGNLPLEKVYGYDPVPKELPGENAKHILGAQGNVWTEYMAYPSKVEYMIFPRMSALSEVLWTPKENRNWADFERRLGIQFKRYDLWKAASSKAYYDLKGLVTKVNGNTSWVIKPRKNTTIIKVTDPVGKTIYSTGDSTVFTLTKPGLYTAQQVSRKAANKNQNDLFIGNAIKIEYNTNKATGKNITLAKTPTEKYAGQGGAFG